MGNGSADWGAMGLLIAGYWSADCRLWVLSLWAMGLMIEGYKICRLWVLGLMTVGYRSVDWAKGLSIVGYWSADCGLWVCQLRAMGLLII